MTTTTSVSFHLGPNRLIWSGVPRQGVVFRNTDVVSVPFSLLWGACEMILDAKRVVGLIGDARREDARSTTSSSALAR